MVFSLVLSNHFKAVKVTRKNISSRNKREMFREFTLHFEEDLVHIVLSSKCPATWKMVHFLKSIHFRISLELGAINIKQNIPSRALSPHKAVVFKSIHDALVLLACKFVLEVHSFDRNQILKIVLYSNTLWIVKENGRWSIEEYAFFEVGFPI
jgi:hypothetical protein